MNNKKCIKCDVFKPIDYFPIRSDNGKFRNECSDCVSKYKKERYYATHEHTLKLKKEYRDNPKNKAKRRKWDKKKRKSNPNHKLRINLRTRLNQALKTNVKAGSAVEDLGCSIDELKIYLELKFYPNPKTGQKMTWDNWSIVGWHIDHIKPLSSYDLTKKDQFKKACHYTNLQPMWYYQNIQKGNRI